MRRLLRPIVVRSLKAGLGVGLLAARCAGVCRPLIEGNPSAPLLLALNASRFRGDLEILVESGRFRVLRMPFAWQTRFIKMFYPARMGRLDYFNPDWRPDVAAGQAAYRNFLRRFLAVLYRELGVKAVIGAAIHYTQDLDWGAVSTEMGVPYLVFHRENFVSAPGLRSHYLTHSGEHGRFVGTTVVVQNEIMRDIFTESGFVRPEQICSLGCMRMDALVRRLTQKRTAKPKRKQVVVFSFAHRTGLGKLSRDRGVMGLWSDGPGFGFFEMFDSVHGAIGELAASNPDVDFVVKTKWAGDWFEKIDAAIERRGWSRTALSNLRLTATDDPHELIMQSQVACSFGSTTILEAGISGLPVVIPYYSDALAPEYDDYIHLRDEFSKFDVVSSEDELKRMIVRRLDDPFVDPETIKARLALFEKFVSSLAGDATERYLQLLSDAIADKAPASLVEIPVKARSAA
jgi:hypothetical protein